MSSKPTQLQVPSGLIFNQQDLFLLEVMNDCGFIQQSEKPFRLKSGIESRVYVQGRNDVTDNPQLGWLIGQKTAEIIIANTGQDNRAPCAIGIPTAGNSIASAASLVAYNNDMVTESGEYISYRIMRETVKAHGAGANEWVNGKFDQDHVYWFIDNVVTDCGTKIEAADKLISSGYPALESPWLIFVDRQQGGIARMTAHGFRQIHVAYNLLDITYAMGEIGEWPKELVTLVEAEIAAHQFV